MSLEEKSIYKHGLVTFIDILGFKDIVNNDPHGQKLLNLVSKFRNYTNENAPDEDLKSPKIYQFSDSVVRCYNLNEEGQTGDEKDILLKELDILNYIQGELACNGIFVRGGITTGKLFFSEQGIFGEAYINAYKLEDEHAIYPRIILDHTLSDKYITRGDREKGIYSSDGLCLTREDSDGFHFINYLINFPRELHGEAWHNNERKECIVGYIEPRRDLIKEKLKRYKESNKVRRKYDWLRIYHNHAVHDLLGRNGYDEYHIIM